MKNVDHFPIKTREITHTFIPLSDGTRLSARIWIPEDAESMPVPAILEAIPYRKRDGTYARDAITYPYLSGHGYACIRVDLRGTGESEGLFDDEYVKQEQDDIIEVIHWLAQQSWCTGKVGMMGISWGGFNSLQVAFEAPEPLKAIITLCSTHDRYTDDVHYKDGCLLLENIAWSGYMFNLLAMPPDPALSPEWRTAWRERIDHIKPGCLTWLKHQTRDDYWRHGSVNTDYSAIKAATMVVTGWADAYVNNPPELLEHLQCPKRAIVGPWVHKYPHFAIPGPQIGFLQEALAWWDRWLKGVDNGMEKKPQSNLYLMEPYLAENFYEERKGRWLCDESWPNENLYSETLFPSGRHTLGVSPGEGTLSIASPLTTGSAAGEYGTWMLGPEYPLDQRQDDAHSLCFDHTIYEDTHIVGRARVKLRVRSDKACGQMAVRLCDVHPTGDVTRMSYGVLNLALRDSMESISPVVPGQWMDVEIPIDTIAYSLPVGHKLRVSISTAYFPLLWPAKEFCTMDLDLSGCSVTLPLHTLASQVEGSPFAEAEGACGAHIEMVDPVQYKREITTDAMTGRVTTRLVDDMGKNICHDMDGLTLSQRCEETYSVLPKDPQSARATIRWHHTMQRDDLCLEFNSEITFKGDAENFYVKAHQLIHENGSEVSHRHWDEKIPREVV